MGARVTQAFLNWGCITMPGKMLVKPALAERVYYVAHLGSAAGTGTGVPLAFSDQSGANMTGKKLYKADLRGTNFSNADLSNANLFGAFAKDASFKCGLPKSASHAPAFD